MASDKKRRATAKLPKPADAGIGGRPIKQTSGGGFSFETLVGALFGVHILAESSPLDAELGPLKRVDFQVGTTYRWKIDDALLTLDGPEPVRCALSIKSNAQFGKQTAPIEFVGVAWDQLTDSDGPMRSDVDYLGLVTGPRDSNLDVALHDLQQKAKAQDPKALETHIMTPGAAGRRQVALYRSFSPPAATARLLPGALLSRCRFLSFDFDAIPSKDEASAVWMLQQMVASGERADAVAAWNIVRTAVDKLRVPGGYITADRLVAALAPHVRLKAAPSTERDVATISLATRRRMDLVQDFIGTDFRIDRSAEVQQLRTFSSKPRVVMLTGASGVGKTVVAKRLAQAIGAEAPVFWLAAEEDLLRQSVLEVERALGLSHPLAAVLNAQPATHALLVLDGLDRVFHPVASSNVFTLLTELLTQADQLERRWLIAVPCQDSQVDAVATALRIRDLPGVSLEAYRIEPPTVDVLQNLWKRYPALGFVANQVHLQSFLTRPKVLSYLVQSGWTSEATAKLAGESEVIDAIWDRTVKSGPQRYARERHVMDLATIMGDELVSAVSFARLQNPDEVLTQLVDDGTLVDQNNRLSFDHDLLGDWARLKVLCAQGDEVAVFLNARATSPLWLRALRLFSARLLENNPNPTAWKGLHAQFMSKPSTELLADALLDGVFFSASAISNLGNLWPALAENDGLLLQRLLARFLYVGTEPSDQARVMVQAAGPDYAACIESKFRSPNQWLWVSMLMFLGTRTEEAARLALAECAHISNLWLSQRPVGFPLRQEAASLAMACVSEHLVRHSRRQYGAMLDREDREHVFNAMLAAWPEREAEIRRLVLLLCGRGQVERVVEERPVRRRAGIPVSLSDLGSSEPPEPWPEGPRHPVDTDFSRLCLAFPGFALARVMQSDAECAVEALLGLLIEERERSRSQHGYEIDESCSLEKHYEWYPPHPWRGPFFAFLTINAEGALRLVLQICAFATQRRLDGLEERHQRPPSVSIGLPDGGRREYIGGSTTFFWHRGITTPGPHTLACALMALEKWLYDKIEKEEEIAGIIEYLLRESDSLAMLGLLSTVGKRAPSMYATVLRPLLNEPLLLWWDSSYVNQAILSPPMIGTSRDPVSHDAVQKWYSMEHRNIALEDVAQRLMLHGTFDASTLRANIVRELASVDAASDFGQYLRTLDARVDSANCHQEQVDGEKVQWTWTPPEALRQEAMDRHQAFQEAWDPSHLISYDCRQVLDKGQSLTSVQTDQLWNSVFGASASPRLAGDTKVAAAAALLVSASQWCATHLAEAAACRATVLEAVSLKPLGDSDSAWMSNKLSADVFCADALPAVWAADRSAVAVRRAVATVLTNGNSRATLHLLWGAFRCPELATEVTPLVNLVGAWAQQRPRRWIRLRSPRQEARQMRIDAALERWRAGAIDAFTQGHSSRSATEFLANLRARLASHSLYRLSARRGRNPIQLDEELVNAVVVSMPPIAEVAPGDPLLEVWTLIQRRAMGVVLNKFDEAEAEALEVEEPLGNLDRSLLSRLALDLPSYTDKGPARALWNRLLDLGGAAHAQVEVFLDAFVEGGFERGWPEPFLALWMEMTDYCFASPSWQGKASHWYRVQRLWTHLLGLSGNLSHRWTPNRTQVALLLRPALERFVRERVNCSESAAALFYMLGKPAALPIRFEALQWIAARLPLWREGVWWHDRDKPQDALADLVRSALSQTDPPLGRVRPAHNAVRTILATLATRQHKVALYLLDQLASFKES